MNTIFLKLKNRLNNYNEYKNPSMSNIIVIIFIFIALLIEIILLIKMYIDVKIQTKCNICKLNE